MSHQSPESITSLPWLLQLWIRSSRIISRKTRSNITDSETAVPFRRGRTIKLSPSRRFICDLLHFAERVPGVPMQRRMQLQPLIEARRQWPQRVSWCAIFMKAYAIVAAERPELRRAYLSYPWGHLYEHPESVASFSVEREHDGENSVFFERISRPELLSLGELTERVRHCQQVPLEQFPSARQVLLLSRLPRPLRRLVWWLGLETDGTCRAHFFGTFAISVVASHGAASLLVRSPLSTTLNYGVFEPDGSLDVRITYDHRVLDGATMARAIVALEDVLRNEILQELRDGIPQPNLPASTAWQATDRHPLAPGAPLATAHSPITVGTTAAAAVS